MNWLSGSPKSSHSANARRVPHEKRRDPDCGQALAVFMFPVRHTPLGTEYLLEVTQHVEAHLRDDRDDDVAD